MYTFNDLVDIIAELRSDHGCPWDREVYDAVDNHDMENLCEELGDVLLQVMLNSQIAKEEGAFTIDDVISGLCKKLIRRHPHVFGDAKVSSTEEGLALWNAIKEQEKAEKKRKCLDKN